MKRGSGFEESGSRGLWLGIGVAVGTAVGLGVRTVWERRNLLGSRNLRARLTPQAEANEGRRLIEQYARAMAGDDVDAMVQFHQEEMISDSMTMLARPQPLRSPKELRDWLAIFQEGFPNKTWTLENVLVEGSQAAFQWRIQGTNVGPFRGVIEPTNKPIDIRGCSVVEIRDGKIARETSYWDSALLLRQVGVLPDMNFGGPPSIDRQRP